MLNGAGSGALSVQGGPPMANGHGHGHHSNGRGLDTVASKVELRHSEPQSTRILCDLMTGC